MGCSDKEVNPRKGIETPSLPPTMPRSIGAVGKMQILERGLKPVPQSWHQHQLQRVRKELILERGLKLTHESNSPAVNDDFWV